VKCGEYKDDQDNIHKIDGLCGTPTTKTVKMVGTHYDLYICDKCFRERYKSKRTGTMKGKK